MRKIYFLAMLFAASVSLTSKAESSVKISVDLFGQEGFTFGGEYYEGDDRVMPVDWVEYKGFRISFNVYPEDWEDPTGTLPFPPRDPIYMLPVEGAPNAPQWRVFANNEFSVSAPEGEALKSIEIIMTEDNFKYGEVTVSDGSIICNGGDTDVEAADKIPAKPYLWKCDNEQGYQSVTFKVAGKEFDGKANQQFFFTCVDINSTTQSAIETNEAGKNVTVYGIDGTKVLDNAPAEAVENLNSGIYVINGKKVIVRK